MVETSLHIYKNDFLGLLRKFTATKNDNIQLKIYTSATVTQLGMCKVKLKSNIKQKICKFFVVPGNEQALLGMPTLTY